jgi:hypothetical protein
MGAGSPGLPCFADPSRATAIVVPYRWAGTNEKGQLASCQLTFSVVTRALRQLQDWPQTDETSPTHWASHLLLQQNESAAQILPAQVSHDAVSLVPVEQMACAQVPPPQV